MNYLFELRYTLRLMRNKLSFTAISIFVIAVGIGISIPLLSMIRFMGFQDIPLENGDRFVVLRQVDPNQGNTTLIDPFVLRQVQASANSYENIGAYRDSSAILSDGETAEIFAAANILATTFSLANTSPLLGRGLQAGDEVVGAVPVAVISYELWQSYYVGAENIVGQQSRINGKSYSIVGVMPEEFAFPVEHDLWLPLQLDSSPAPGADRTLNIVGLVKNGVSLGTASTEFTAVMQSLGNEFPEYYGGITGVVMPYVVVGISDGLLFGQLMIGLMITILLLVCFNVTNLLTVRSSERISELAVRGALGGTPWRIMRQVLLESFLICLMAAIAGLGLGLLGLSAMEAGFASSPGTTPFWVTFDLQLHDVLNVLSLTSLIWLFSGLYPAWKISRQELSNVLNNDSSSIAGGAAGRLTRSLVTLEIVASCFLLIVCLYFLIALYRSAHMDMGIDSEGFLSASINLSSANYADAESKLRFLDNLENEALNLDQFSQLTYATALAGNGSRRLTYGLEDRDLSTEGRFPNVGLEWTSSNYAESMGISVLAGRYFDATDNENSLSVVVVDELFAQRFWPGESALGKRVQLQPDEQGEWLTVVGVINHLIQGQPTAERLYQSTLYRPLPQLSLADRVIQERASTIYMAVAAANLEMTPLRDFEQLLKVAVSRVDRDIPLSNIMTLDRSKYLIMEIIAIVSDLMLWVSLSTLILAVVGIFGVVSRSVLSRGKEIGIRRALGSSNFNIINIFLKQGSFYLLIGALLGGTSAIMIVNLISGAIGSQTGTGNVLWIAVLVLICLGALVFAASYVPARKLIICEPGEALHYE